MSSIRFIRAVAAARGVSRFLFGRSVFWAKESLFFGRSFLPAFVACSIVCLRFLRVGSWRVVGSSLVARLVVWSLGGEWLVIMSGNFAGRVGLLMRSGFMWGLWLRWVRSLGSVRGVK